MKRRTFNQVALVGLAAGIGAPLYAGSGLTQSSVRECFRHIDSQPDWDWVPFTIGLGRCGRELAAQLDLVIEPEHPALIYAESDMPSPSTPTQINYSEDALLTNAYAGVLIVSLDEPEMWPNAIAWSEKMRAHDVYLTAAIICVPDINTGLSHPLTQQLRGDLDTVILQQDCRQKPQPAGFNPALQSARLFLMEPGLICHDIADIRTVLKGKTAITATSPGLSSRLGGDLKQAVDACYTTLRGRPVSGGIARWSAGLETLSISDFDAIGNQLGERLSDDFTLLVTMNVDLSASATSPGILHTIWALSEGS